MITTILGGLLLLGKTIILFVVTMFESLRNEGLGLISLLIFLLTGLLVFEGYREIRNRISSDKDRKNNDTEMWLHKFADFLSVVIGAVVTFYLNNHIGLGAVAAAGIVGILGFVVASKYEVPIYCGSFVGMSSANVYDFEHLLIASVLAGVIFVITKRIFKGFGGKLGTIALLGAVLSAVITGREFTKSSLPEWEVGLLIMFFAIIGILATYILNVRFGKSPVLSSATIGLIGGLVLPEIFPEIGQILALVVICASFAGMSSKERLPNEFYAVIAGMFCGVIFIFSAPYFGGAGGKLGTIAFGAVISVAALRRFGVLFKK
ncbi:hypothetical protein QQE94_03095 [Fervidobacterium pennivorans subsp. shakshaketiis]|uniref:hypothetical protein n=1 Tax=Fervidobacterium TaxID=2422 RepID=UPI000AC5C13D|nr:hypothetical protein [Fervidobacterium pennivorans]